ncbi:carbamoyl-phosphate synthase small subunit [Marinococcus luteus]|uniref:Carbamoyl phosphate synthase small chain n=1 Tax=Marinococcus luteus TaxID=1122204 RepID=A0A1H2VD14_9BACI|nr:carbamoyl phosphate synthase small subunit [Marinococcus luteus]SDW66247.1 carbamoyl-phosphate synthase small subunit [Marinococcus luteus]
MKSYIKLETGEIFEGSWQQAFPDTYGEIVFFTGMTGYQEVMTDPSFHGQIVVFTYPLIGNYGVNPTDNESTQPQPAGIIVSEACGTSGHYEGDQTLAEAALAAGIPVMENVDTRALVKNIREKGDMGAVMSGNPESVNVGEYEPLGERDVIDTVTVDKQITVGSGDRHVVLMDFGYKQSMVDQLNKKGCKVTIVPYDTPKETIEGLAPDGLLFSNGPGNPKQLEHYLSTYKELAETYPTLGICLGHQLLALAFGGETEKLRFGHRGANQPVQDLETNKVFMSSQNHSYVVTDESLPKESFRIKYKNVNDGSVEGMMHTKFPIMTAQFHPEAHPGPADSEEIFDEFLETIENKGREATYA